MVYEKPKDYIRKYAPANSSTPFALLCRICGHPVDAIHMIDDDLCGHCDRVKSAHSDQNRHEAPVTIKGKTREIPTKDGGVVKIKVAAQTFKGEELDVDFEGYLKLKSRAKWYALRRMTSIEAVTKAMEHEKSRGKVLYNTAIVRLKKLAR